MKFLAVGLGNPGPEYRDSRHNVGFLVVEEIASAVGAVFTTARYGDVAEVRHKGRTWLLLKPNTFMNLSGNAVRYWCEVKGVPLDRLVVITDDIALPYGKLRLRARGGAGGHNGLSNIIAVLGTENFARLRFGIGDGFARGRQVDHVLGAWSPEERAGLQERVEVAAKAVIEIGHAGMERVMNNVNTG